MARKRPAAKTPRKGQQKARKKVSFIPKGYHSVTPYLACKGAASAIDFYKKAFGAAEVMRMPGPNGTVGHAEIRIGDSRVMLTDEYPEMEFMSPQTRGGTTVHIHVYVRDVDGMVERAVDAGAKLLRPVEDKFYGDRSGSVEDPFGHVWHLATHKKDVSMAQLRKGAQQAVEKMGSAQ
jgi:PhnB protein